MINRFCQKQLFFNPCPPLILALVGGALIFSGCSKAKSPVSATPAPPADSVQPAQPASAPVENSPSPPSPAQRAVAAIPTVTPDGQPDLGALNRSLIRWVVGNRRPPANFADFAATAGVPIPPPPAGKKYFITKNMHIQLVAE
jgi:hypothetical protein